MLRGSRRRVNVARRQQWEPEWTPPQQERRRSIFWPVVGALLFVFVFLPVVMFVGCAACGIAVGGS
jgi:hypothetical protein